MFTQLYKKRNEIEAGKLKQLVCDEMTKIFMGTNFQYSNSIASEMANNVIDGATITCGCGHEQPNLVHIHDIGKFVNSIGDKLIAVKYVSDPDHVVIGTTDKITAEVLDLKGRTIEERGSSHTSNKHDLELYEECLDEAHEQSDKFIQKLTTDYLPYETHYYLLSEMEALNTERMDKLINDNFDNLVKMESDCLIKELKAMCNLKN